MRDAKGIRNPKLMSVAAEQSIQQTGGANTDALTGQADEATVIGEEFTEAQAAAKEGLAAAEEPNPFSSSEEKSEEQSEKKSEKEESEQSESEKKSE